MVDFSDISPHIHLKISPKAKRMALRLDSRARRINLVIPKKSSLKKAYEFAESYQDWIETKINELPSPIPFKNNVVLPILGIAHTLRIEKIDLKTTKFEIRNGEFIVKTCLDDPSPRISRYLKSIALQELGKLSHDKATKLNRKLSKFVVRDMKSRWGSCSTDGRMTLSWRLIFAPMEAVDYVISHEVAHLIHPNHGSKFWTLCEKLSDNFTAGHSWMQKNGSNLGRYGETPLL